ncbi:MAG: hypothetical protein V3S33_07215 [Gammaproteobacteria bacterium]
MNTNKLIAENGKIFFLACLAFTLAAGAYLRFHRLDQVGLHGSDALYYTSIALAWVRGDFIYSIADQATVFRPVLHLLFAGALKVFGETDFAIKSFNAGVDTANILLVIGLARAISKSWSVALASAITYAFLPMAIHFARYELAHAISTFFVLAAGLVFCGSWKSKSPRVRLALLGTSGALLGLGSLTHEDLLFLVLPFAAFIPVLSAQVETGKRLSTIAIDILALCAAPFVCGLVIVSRNLDLVTSIADGAMTKDQFFIGKFARYGWDALLASSSALFAAFFLAASLLALLLLLRRLVTGQSSAGELSPLSYWGFLVFFGYIALTAFFFDALFVRATLPVVPFVIITTFIWVEWAAGKLRRSSGGIAILMLAALLIPFNLNNYRPTDFSGRVFSQEWGHARLLSKASLVTSWELFLRRNFTKKIWGAIYHDYRDRIGPESKLLIAPSIVYPFPGRRALQSEIYFGDNAVYLFDHDEPFVALINKQKIKYVLITSMNIRPSSSELTPGRTYLYNGRWSPEHPIVLGASFRFPPGGYTLEKELHALRSILRRMGGRVLQSSPLAIVVAL